MVTTIQIDEGIKEKLDTLKIHHRESYNELISRLISVANPQNCSRESLVETIDVLSDSTSIMNIAEALERFERGEKGINFENLKKELKLNV
jgi:predicted CopG family antitoxin